MPKLRPLRKQEEIDKVPVTEPVEIALEPDTGIVELEPGGGSGGELEKKESPARVETVEAREPEPEDEGEVQLRKQLEEANRQVAETRLREQDAERRRQHAERSLHQVQQTSEQAQYDAILNAIGASQEAASSAKAEYRRAIEANEWDAATDAQERMTEAKTRLVQLEDGKAAYEMRLEQIKNQPQQQQRQPTVTEFIERNDQFMPAEKDWLKKHPEVLTDPRKYTALQHHYYDAVKHGRGSEAYFDHLETALGYRQSDERQPQRQQRASSVQAPPSREVPSISGGHTSPTRITLSAAEREHAKISGVTELEYAKGKVEMEKRKANGNLQTG